MEIIRCCATNFINVVTLMLSLLVVVYLYRVLLRVEKRLYKPLLYCLLAVIAYASIHLIELLIDAGFILSTTAMGIVLESLHLVVAIFLLLDFWVFQKTLRLEDGEITYKKKRTK